MTTEPRARCRCISGHHHNHDWPTQQLPVLPETTALPLPLPEAQPRNIDIRINSNGSRTVYGGWPAYTLVSPALLQHLDPTVARLHGNHLVFWDGTVYVLGEAITHDSGWTVIQAYRLMMPTPEGSAEDARIT